MLQRNKDVIKKMTESKPFPPGPLCIENFILYRIASAETKTINGLNVIEYPNVAPAYKGQQFHGTKTVQALCQSAAVVSGRVIRSLLGSGPGLDPRLCGSLLTLHREEFG